MTNVTADPAKVRRRSQLYRWHENHDAAFIKRADATYVATYGDSRNETAAAVRLGICDLSLLPRQGITGADSTGWLRVHGYAIPQRPNTAVKQTENDLLVRLSAEEFLCLRLSVLEDGPPTGQPAWPVDGDGDAFPLPRADSHCLFAVTGDAAPAMFSKVCAVDLRSHKFANGCVAQTSVARINAIVIRHDLQQTQGFFVLTATSAAEYLWDCLLDAINEYEGQPVGIDALQAISNTTT